MLLALTRFEVNEAYARVNQYYLKSMVCLADEEVKTFGEEKKQFRRWRSGRRQKRL
jgi:hypothetical protein